MSKRRIIISRILAVVCALSIFAGVFASAPSKPATFSDVNPGDWFYPYVTEMAEIGAVSGFTDGNFRPNATVSRLEAYTMALGMFPRESYSADELAKVEAVNGPDFWGNRTIAQSIYDELNMFGLSAEEWSKPATRDELACLLGMSYAGYMIEVKGEEPHGGYMEASMLIGDYATAVAGTPYEDWIIWMYSNGIISGVNANGDFNPSGTASRAVCCTMLSSLYHPERWKKIDFEALMEQANKPAQGVDFNGTARVRYANDVAYDYCRALENEIGIQIFYLPEWTPKANGLIQHEDVADFAGYTEYFEDVLAELKIMKAAYDLYPDGFLKEMAARKGNRKAEIILCPYTFEGISCYGVHVYDSSGDAQKVDQIYYTGSGNAQYYSHEMGHMVMSSAAVLNGWNKTCERWLSLSSGSSSYISGYAMTSRAEDWAETWAHLWHQTDIVRRACSDSGMKAKVQYLTELLDQYESVDVSKLPWADIANR